MDQAQSICVHVHRASQPVNGKSSILLGKTMPRHCVLEQRSVETLRMSLPEQQQSNTPGTGTRNVKIGAPLHMLHQRILLLRKSVDETLHLVRL
ncbi:MAG: hypothetical protein LC804_08880 [Acidobacteria bacterium]|nr:hypothetical protein [Acidobacteriota bacterium]